MPELNCVDMSKWGGDFTDAEAQAMKALGIDTVIVATGPGGYGERAAQQAATTVRNGMRLEAYAFLEFDSDPGWWVDRSVERLAGYHVRRWWLDIEDNAHGLWMSPFQRIVYVQTALDRFNVHGIFAHIYSANWYWPTYMGNTDRFSGQGRKLWNSWYDNDADIDGLPFGGWTKADVAIEQYQGTTEVCGQSVDLNHLYFTGEESDMTPDEVKALIEEVVAPLRTELRGLNEAVMKRFNIIGVATESIDTVEEAARRLDGIHG